MKTTFLMLGAALLAAPATANAQAVSDSAGIRATALDYMEGWYAADGARMERSLHPELAKRNTFVDANNRRSRLIQMSAMTLVQGARDGGGRDIPASDRKRGVAILDIYGNAASVRADMAGWIDYMHMIKWNGQWKIINVLWENSPDRRR
jgi:hypothetical protein